MENIKNILIENAIGTIQTSGVHSLTMRNLGETVGIKSASVMYHFKSKDNMIKELVNDYYYNFFDKLSNINKFKISPNDKLIKLVDIFQDVLNSNKFCLCGMLAIEHNNLSEETNEVLSIFFKKLDEWISNILVDMNLEVYFSKLIIASLEGAILIDKMNKSNLHLNAVKFFINDLKR